MRNETQTLKLRIERKKEGKLHISHFSEKASMHLDIIERLIDKANRLHVRAELIESIFENGYIREDNINQLKREVR